MKKILFAVFITILCSSCANKELENELKKEISTLKTELKESQKERNDLAKQLQECIHGNSYKDIQNIGRWKDVRPNSNITITIFKNLKSNKLYIKHSFKDGSNGVEEARISNRKGLKSYEFINNTHNEYYVIKGDGDLDMYSQNGKFATALCF